MTRYRLQQEGPYADGVKPEEPAVVIMCDGHRLAAVVPFDHTAPPSSRPRTVTSGAVVVQDRRNVPGDAIEPLTRPGYGVEWRLDGVTVRTWTTSRNWRTSWPPARDTASSNLYPGRAEVPARPFTCRRHPGGHYLDGAALRQVVDTAQHRGRQIVVPVSRVSQIDR